MGSIADEGSGYAWCGKHRNVLRGKGVRISRALPAYVGAAGNLKADLSFDIKFGKDGKPLYIAGPRDNVNAVMRKLTAKAGEGNFDYVLLLGEEEIDI